jgi:hypothetical protein
MPALTDLAVTSPDGHIVLIVECKGGSSAPAAEASRFRRNLLNHQLLPPAHFFMLVYPKSIYLWKAETPADAPPDFDAPFSTILQEYAPTLSEPSFPLQGSSLEFVIHSWLSEIAAGIRKPKSDSAAEQLLVKSGLYSSLLNSKITSRLSV